MLASTRLVFVLSLAAGSASLVSTAAAQTPKQRADALNAEGKAMLQAKPMRAAEAAEKFRQAIVLVPEGDYYWNLCMALYHKGELSDALTACRAVEPNGGSAASVKQANVAMEKHIKPMIIAAGLLVRALAAHRSRHADELGAERPGVLVG
ncbi:MAG TPA: hypothetical protein VM734_25750, partial [Kofleriaceae bacterium]|nr:hypothetical protein [Kofleriaceae bacterium]